MQIQNKSNQFILGGLKPGFPILRQTRVPKNEQNDTALKT